MENDDKLADILSKYTHVEQGYKNTHNEATGVMLLDDSIVTFVKITGVWYEKLIIETQTKGTFKIHALSLSNISSNWLVESNRGSVKIRFMEPSEW